MTSTLGEEGGWQEEGGTGWYGKSELLSDVGGKGLGLPIFIFYLLKKIEFAP